MNWEQVCEIPYFQDIPFKIELNRVGHIIMSPAKNIHSVLQWAIQQRIYELMKQHGYCPNARFRPQITSKLRM